MAVQPVVDPARRVGHHREEGELVDDALVDGRRLQEEQELAARGQRVEVLQRLDQVLERAPLIRLGVAFGVGGLGELGEQLHGEHVGALRPEGLAQGLGQARVHLVQVHHPDHPVDVEPLDVGGGEVERGRRRVGPVQKPGGEAVVLGHRQQVPERGEVAEQPLGVFAEVAQQVPLHLRVGTAEPDQRRLQRVAGVGQPAEHVRRAEPPDGGIPRRVEQLVLDLRPGCDPDVVAHGAAPVPAGIGAGRRRMRSDGARSLLFNHTPPPPLQSGIVNSER